MPPERPTELDVHGIVRALVPLYGVRVVPEKLARMAAERLTHALDVAVRLELPDSLDGRVYGDLPDGPVWEVAFDHAGVPGRLRAAGDAPAPEIAAILKIELQRLAEYLGTLSDVSSDVDRLEFRLQALHQISRTLSIAREIPETETHIVDFTGELFFTWWTALYRPLDPGTLELRQIRSLSESGPLQQIRAADLVDLLPIEAESEAVLLTDRRHWLPEDARALGTLDMGGRRLGCLVLGPRMTGDPYTQEDIQLLGTLAHSSAIALRNAELVAELREKAILDELTGLYNRRFLEDRLGEELDRARRYRRGLSLILLDLDQFKSYNDTYGHSAGDVLLARIGALIRANTRVVDLPCRYGGEEFAVIAPETGLSQAEGLAQRLHDAIVGLEPVTGVYRRITVSAGVACFPDHAGEAGQLLEAADRAMYRAKAEGRDRVISA